jgi:hypothetical protein
MQVGVWVRGFLSISFPVLGSRDQVQMKGHWPKLDTEGQDRMGHSPPREDRGASDAPIRSGWRWQAPGKSGEVGGIPCFNASFTMWTAGAVIFFRTCRPLARPNLGRKVRYCHVAWMNEVGSGATPDKSPRWRPVSASASSVRCFAATRSGGSTTMSRC